MRAWRTVVAIAVVAAVAHPTAGSAGVAYIEIAGSRSASVDVLLRDRVTLYLSGTPGMGGGGGRSYSGVMIEDAQGNLVAGTIGVNDFTKFSYPIDLYFGSSDGPGRVTLDRGRYRFTLLTDGPTALSIPTSGIALSLRPTRPRSVRGTVRDLYSPVPVTGGRIPLGPMTKRSFVLVASNQDYEVGVGANAMELCVTERGARCPTDRPLENVGAYPVIPQPLPGPSGLLGWRWYAKGEFENRDVESFTTLVGTGIPMLQKTFALVVD